MDTYPERIPEEEAEYYNDKEAAESKCQCLEYLCPLFGRRKRGGGERRSLLHGDCARKNWLKRRGHRVKAVVLESIGELKLRALLRKLRARSMAKKVPVFSYDSTSYALNFDEGTGHGVEERCLLNFSERLEAAQTV